MSDWWITKTQVVLPFKVLIRICKGSKIEQILVWYIWSILTIIKQGTVWYYCDYFDDTDWHIIGSIINIFKNWIIYNKSSYFTMLWMDKELQLEFWDLMAILSRIRRPKVNEYIQVILWNKCYHWWWSYTVQLYFVSSLAFGCISKKKTIVFASAWKYFCNMIAHGVANSVSIIIVYWFKCIKLDFAVHCLWFFKIPAFQNKIIITECHKQIVVRNNIHKYHN